MELLGHSQKRTTMDIYSHVMPALAREAADHMGALSRQVRAGELQPETTQAAPREGDGLAIGWS